MIFSSSAIHVKGPIAAPLRETLKAKWLPIFALAAMGAAIALTPPQNPVIHARTPLEWVAHELGHGINSVWVGISLLLLVFPSLWNTLKCKRPDLWAWRALDAILLDFLCVDALGKDVFTGLVRPGAPPRPGFPSGHAMMAWLMAWLVWRRYPKLGPLWFGMAAFISWSRVESHAHFPYQVLAGALMGCVGGALIAGRQAGVLLPRILLSDHALSARLGLASRAKTAEALSEALSNTP